MFDTVNVWGKCPYCHQHQYYDAQTKDLDNCLHTFDALHKDWYKGKLERKFRLGLPVFKHFPLDKEDKVWKNQAERIEAQATVSPQFRKLKYVEVCICCLSDKCKAFAIERDKRIQGCFSGFGRRFDGRIRIKDGKLIGEVYDIILSEKSLPKKRKIKNSLRVINPMALK